MSNPYKDVVTDYGGTQYNTGPDVLNLQIRNKHKNEWYEKLRDRLETILGVLSGNDRDGNYQYSHQPFIEKSGDTSTTPSSAIDSTVWQQYPGGKNSGPMHDLWNTPSENRDSRTQGGSHNQPFPYTASSNLSRIYSAIDLDYELEVEHLPLNTPLPEDRPITSKQIADYLNYLNDQWSTIVEDPSIILYQRIAQLTQTVRYQVAYLWTKTEFPKELLLNFVYDWLYNNTVVRQAMRLAGMELTDKRNLENLLQGLTKLVYKMRSIEDNTQVSRVVNYNQRFFY